MVKKYERRIERIDIAKDFLEDFFLGKEIHLKICEPFPKDTKIVAMGTDVAKGTIVAIIESQTFPLVAQGGTPPQHLFAVEDISKRTS